MASGFLSPVNVMKENVFVFFKLLNQSQTIQSKSFKSISPLGLGMTNVFLIIRKITFQGNDMHFGAAVILKLFKVSLLFRAGKTDELGDRFLVSSRTREEVAHVVVDGRLGADLHPVRHRVMNPRQDH